MLANQFRQLHQQIDDLFALFDQTSLSAQHIRATQRCAQNILALMQEHPEALAAQAFTYRKPHSPIVNLGYASTVMALLLCIRQRWNMTSTEQLICGTLTLAAAHQSQLHERLFTKEEPKSLAISPNAKLIRALENTGLTLWADALKCSPNLLLHCSGKKKFARRWTPWQGIVYTAYQLCVGQLPQALLPRLNWPNHLRRVMQTADKGLYELVSPLISYTSFFPPGIKIKLDTGETLRVLGPSAEGYSALDDTLEMVVVKPQHIRSVAPMGILQDDVVEHCWGEQWQLHKETTEVKACIHPRFAIDKPPGALLALQLELDADEPDTGRISQLLDQESLFRHQLQRSATSNARKNLAVNTSRHALMMHGTSRTKHVLLQETLLSRLSQSAFPMQSDLLNFARLRNAVSTVLSQHIKGLLPEELISVTTFASASLFTHPKLKTLTHWPDIASEEWDLMGIADGNLYHELQNISVKLARVWHLDATFIEALGKVQKRKSTAVVANAIEVSLLFAASALVPMAKNSFPLEQKIEQSLSAFSLSAATDANTLKAQIVGAILSATPICELKRNL